MSKGGKKSLDKIVQSGICIYNTVKETNMTIMGSDNNYYGLTDEILPGTLPTESTPDTIQELEQQDDEKTEEIDEDDNGEDTSDDDSDIDEDDDDDDDDSE